MIHPNEVLGELRQPARDLREHIPDVIGAYAQLQRAAMADGALSAKTKELIALAVAVTREWRRVRRRSCPWGGPPGTPRRRRWPKRSASPYC